MDRLAPKDTSGYFSLPHKHSDASLGRGGGAGVSLSTDIKTCESWEHVLSAMLCHVTQLFTWSFC